MAVGVCHPMTTSLRRAVDEYAGSLMARAPVASMAYPQAVNERASHVGLARAWLALPSVDERHQILVGPEGQACGGSVLWTRRFPGPLRRRMCRAWRCAS
jgi:hypothetical protein